MHTLTATPLLVFAIFISLASTKVIVQQVSWPGNSQPCIYTSYDSSGCQTNNTTDLEAYQCLCSNGGGFIGMSATCISEDDPKDLEDVWDKLSIVCELWESPIEYEKKDFLAGRGSSSAPSTTSMSSPAGSATSSPTNTGSNGNADDGINHSNNGHLSVKSIALIASMSGLAAVLIVVGGLFWRRRAFKRRGAGDDQWIKKMSEMQSDDGIREPSIPLGQYSR